jgi:hypothetical protein
MNRPPATLFLIFFVPFVVYAIYVWFAKRQGIQRRYWRIRTFMTLAIVGLLMMVGNLLYLVQFGGAVPGADYAPAHMENGQFVRQRVNR